MNTAVLLMCLSGSGAVGQPDNVVFRAPHIEVRHDQERGKQAIGYSYLMYHRIYMGRGYHKPKDRKDHGKPDVDFSRLPTTYFHDQSPIGVVLAKYDWFASPPNRYHADARQPASMIGMAVNPLANLANLWAEPPIAVLGMDVGTLAAYARPSQTFHFTERVPAFVKLSLPDKKQTRHFHFVQDALDRGVNLRIFAGEPRAMFEKHGGDRFYQAIVIETYKFPDAELHKELMTVEAVKMMLSKLRDGGILCFHISNRYYDLTPLLLSTAAELKCAAVIGRDIAEREEKGPTQHRFSSEWVMIARSEKDLAHLKTPGGARERAFEGEVDYWRRDTVDKKILWSDKAEQSLRGMFRSDPEIDALTESLFRFQDWLSASAGASPWDIYRATDPVRSFIRSWSARSARAKNGGHLPGDKPTPEPFDPSVPFKAPNIEVRVERNERGEYYYLMHNGTYMGRNYKEPRKKEDRGNPAKDFSRLPITYFHDKSPIGMVMQKYNWFPGPDNTFAADARLPASMIGMGNVWGMTANLWSEPPIGSVGMDVATLAAYARPAQTMHFSERLPVLAKLSLPDAKKSAYFRYLRDALERGAAVKVFDGEPREAFEKKGGDGFYQVIAVLTYKLPVVELHDELMTKEAMQMLMSKTRADGILCFHTSNRYYELTPILASAAKELKYACLVGRDWVEWPGDAPRDRFSSEWVIVARDWNHLAHLKVPDGFDKANRDNSPYWDPEPKTAKKFVWSDKGERSLRGLYRSDPQVDMTRDAVGRFAYWAGESVGVPNIRIYRAMQPVNDMFRAWSKSSADEKNRDPDEKK